ncbi:hypothetical protein L3V86_02450 [Thiotrichales bacterium 19S11-10]|nr:hypothetical protein [Thiotrichales bacterium 19S11-10]
MLSQDVLDQLSSIKEKMDQYKLKSERDREELNGLFEQIKQNLDFKSSPQTNKNRYNAILLDRLEKVKNFISNKEIIKGLEILINKDSDDLRAKTTVKKEGIIEAKPKVTEPQKEEKKKTTQNLTNIEAALNKKVEAQTPNSIVKQIKKQNSQTLKQQILNSIILSMNDFYNEYGVSSYLPIRWATDLTGKLTNALAIYQLLETDKLTNSEAMYVMSQNSQFGDKSLATYFYKQLVSSLNIKTIISINGEFAQTATETIKPEMTKQKLELLEQKKSNLYLSNATEFLRTKNMAQTPTDFTRAGFSHSPIDSSSSSSSSSTNPTPVMQQTGEKRKEEAKLTSSQDHTS